MKSSSKRHAVLSNDLITETHSKGLLVAGFILLIPIGLFNLVTITDMFSRYIVVFIVLSAIFCFIDIAIFGILIVRGCLLI